MYARRQNLIKAAYSSDAVDQEAYCEDPLAYDVWQPQSTLKRHDPDALAEAKGKQQMTHAKHGLAIGAAVALGAYFVLGAPPTTALLGGAVVGGGAYAYMSKHGHA